MQNARQSCFKIASSRASMSGGKLAILLGLLLAGHAALSQSGAAYPESKGPVSDYAGKLSASQVNELTGTIAEYERQTSIPFAVVVIDDLHGEPAGQYAIELGDLWRLGQPGRDNGVILLWAPRERAYSLRLASGLKADISDADAVAITRQYLLPNFKREQYFEGLRDTVLATMRSLGNKTWEERIQSRAQALLEEQRAAEKRQEEESKESEAFWQIFAIAGGLLAISGLAGIIIYKRSQRQKKLAEMADAKRAIANELAKAEGNAPRVQALLDDFSKEVPEQDLSTLRTELAGQPARILQIKLDATTLDFEDLDSYDAAIDTQARAETESDLLQVTQQRISDIRRAKKRGQTLLEKRSKESFTITELRDSSRRGEIDRLLLQSRRDYEQARQDSSLSMFDWLMIDNLLHQSHSHSQQAVDFSEAEPVVFSASSNNSKRSFWDSSDSSFDSSSSDSSSSTSFDSGSGSDGSY